MHFTEMGFEQFCVGRVEVGGATGGEQKNGGGLFVLFTVRGTF